MIDHGKEPCDEEGSPGKARDGGIDLEEMCLVAMIDIEVNQHKTRTRCFQILVDYAHTASITSNWDTRRVRGNMNLK